MTQDKRTSTTASIRDDFPVLKQTSHDRPLVYLDNAATSQKPQAVIDVMTEFYQTAYATVHRGVYQLSQVATQRCENVRHQVQNWIGADQSSEIIFTKGTTEAINLVAASFAETYLKPGQEILISEIEHHANIVPWQMAAQKRGLTVNVIPVDDNGDLDLAAFQNRLTEKTGLVAVGHVSNALGTVHPIREIISAAHRVGAKVLIDGAQAVSHMAVDVQALDCDFYCFSGHKMLGPTGIGVLYGKADLLNKMAPYQTGGDMIETVSFSGTTFAALPHKFEAGTPPIVEIIGLGEAISYIEKIGFDTISQIEDELTNCVVQALSQEPGIRLIGEPSHRAGVASFEVEGVHPHDVGTILDTEGVAIRAGHHCAQPAMKRFGVPATARASVAFYNTRSDIDRLMAGIRQVKQIML